MAIAALAMCACGDVEYISTAGEVAVDGTAKEVGFRIRAANRDGSPAVGVPVVIRSIEGGGIQAEVAASTNAGGFADVRWHVENAAQAVEIAAGAPDGDTQALAVVSATIDSGGGIHPLITQITIPKMDGGGKEAGASKPTASQLTVELR